MVGAQWSGNSWWESGRERKTKVAKWTSWGEMEKNENREKDVLFSADTRSSVTKLSLPIILRAQKNIGEPTQSSLFFRSSLHCIWPLTFTHPFPTGYQSWLPPTPPLDSYYPAFCLLWSLSPGWLPPGRVASLHDEERSIAPACRPSRVRVFDTSVVELLKGSQSPPLSSIAAKHELRGSSISSCGFLSTFSSASFSPAARAYSSTCACFLFTLLFLCFCEVAHRWHSDKGRSSPGVYL